MSEPPPVTPPDPADAVDRDVEARDPRIPGDIGGRSPAQWTLVGITLSLALAVGAYRLLHYEALDQTAALFVGLPTILAVALTLTPRAKSAVGMVVKGLTIGLLLSGIVLGEGVVCVLMAAPLFYLVGITIAVAIDHDRKKQRPLYSVVVLPLILMSLEGVTPATSLPSEEAVSATRIVAATPDAVEATLTAKPEFRTALPALQRMGFPTPIGGTGTGLDVGDRRGIMVRTSGGQAATVTMEVVERGSGYVRLRSISDDTPIARWMTWQSSTVTWRAGGNGLTQVTWELRYTRRLSPAWYFAPPERYASALAAAYLIDNLATPR